MLKTIVSACVFAVLACATSTANAQTMDRRTIFTFNQPVSLPGVTLPAGKYLFRVPDASTGRRVVSLTIRKIASSGCPTASDRVQPVKDSATALSDVT